MYVADDLPYLAGIAGVRRHGCAGDSFRNYSKDRLVGVAVFESAGGEIGTGGATSSVRTMAGGALGTEQAGTLGAVLGRVKRIAPGGAAVLGRHSRREKKKRDGGANHIGSCELYQLRLCARD